MQQSNLIIIPSIYIFTPLRPRLQMVAAVLAYRRIFPPIGY
jgi:hypothetical protein